MNRASQFRFLTRHFFDRFFDKDSISPGSDSKSNIIQSMAMLAVPGLMLGFMTLILPTAKGSYALYYFFVSYSMIVMGFVVVYKLKSLLPDKQDYQILCSLPIRYRDLFAAKVVALLLFLSLFSISANIFASCMVPLSQSVGPVLPNFLAHGIAVFSGAIFMALTLCAVQGILMNVLPNRIFSKLSTLFQMVSITVLVTVFLIFPLVASTIEPAVENSASYLGYFPFFWFLGVYVYLLPEGSVNPVFGILAVRAFYGLLVSSALFLTTNAIAYRRHAQSALNELDSQPLRDDGWGFRVRHEMDRVLFRHQTQRACFRFIHAVLRQSSKHQLFLAVYLALGMSLGLSSLFSIDRSAAFPFRIMDKGMLAFPLILSFFVISGLRATFNIPYELQGNWIFKLTEARDSQEYMTGTRKFVSVYGLLPLTPPIAAMEFAYWPWNKALFHVAFASTISLILVEILFLDFRKIPFTCSYYPGRKNMAILGVVYMYGFTTYSSSMVSLEQWLLESAVRGVCFFAVASAFLLFFSSKSLRSNPSRLIFEEKSNTQFQNLELS